MITATITSNAADARAFLVNVTGELKRPKALNDALGRSLARELQAHFRKRNQEPNKMGAKKTGFWSEVAEATVMTEATETGATVTIGEQRFRIHFYGGVIRPTGGRKMLTIPLIAEARGKYVSEYEADTGKKLFRIGNALFERSGLGTQSTTSRQQVSTRTRGGSRMINMRAKSQIRGVYALTPKATIKKDEDAIPDNSKLLQALSETAEKWIAREIRKGGAA